MEQTLQQVQDEAFYEASFPKVDVDALVSVLCRLSYETAWVWPSKVEDAYNYAQEALAYKTGKHYDLEQLHSAVEKLHQRFLVFNKLRNRTGVTYDVENRVFAATNEIWAAAMEDDLRVAWYIHVGEEYQRELTVIFQSYDDLYNQDLMIAEQQKARVTISYPASFNLNEFPMDDLQLHNTPPRRNPSLLLPPTPITDDSWKINQGTTLLPMSPGFINTVMRHQSPVVEEISADEYNQALNNASSSKKNAKKKLSFTENAQCGSSNGSTPVTETRKVHSFEELFGNYHHY